MASGSPRVTTGFAVGRLVEETGWWLFLATLLGAGALSGPTAAQLGLMLGAWLLLRPALIVTGPLVHPLVGYGGPVLLVVAVIALNGAQLVEGLEPILLLVVAAGAARSFGAARRAGLVADAFGQRAGAVATLDSRIGWLGMALGGAAYAVLLPSSFVVPFFLGLLLALVGVALGHVMLPAAGRPRPAAATTRVKPAAGPAAGQAQAGSGFVPLERSAPRTHLVVAASAGALVVGLIALLAERGAAMGGDAAFVGIGIALIGLGGLVSRVPIVRLRQRLPEALLVGVMGWSLAGLVALMGVVGLIGLVAPWSWLLAAGLLSAVGFVAAALVRESVLHLRGLGDRAPRAARRLTLTHAVGQLVGAGVVVVLGGGPPAVGGTLPVLALAAAVAIALGLVADRRSLGALRHQVQEFSWNADPPPRAFEQPPAGSRAARLSGWVNRQVEVELVDVSLPVSGRRYAIARPSGDGRDSLFEQAKTDPERQMPYWAKVWPSGVALADLVVERADEVDGRQVLELGAGLGVTACTVLEEGGRLITADYSLLPLALCRLNGLLNTGRGPGSTCFNWRDEEQVRDVLRRHPPIGLILAADVLYEFRDIGPLIDVIERLLAPGGSLWLAEPVRRTAQRFLDIVATMGWNIDSRRIRAAWPDATDGWVNVHVIRREREPTELVLGLAGGQL